MGLAGIVQLDGAPFDPKDLATMLAAAPWRAPDGTATWHDGQAGLAHMRFCTTPEDRVDGQPLVDEAAGLVLVFDGRLDNRPDLLRDLPGIPADAGDSRLVMAAYHRWGRECPDRFVGDFAMALWDTQRRQLFCARSVLGFRTFQWRRDGRSFVFATEPSQIAALPWVTRRLNEGVMAEMLSLRFLTQEETLLQDFHRLPPGCAMVVGEGERKVWRWHRGPFAEERGATEEDYAVRLRELFDQSLEAVARTDAPFAAWLSGGLDSSTVVCRAEQLRQAGRVRHRVQPLSAVFPGSPEDESAWIAQVEAESGTRPERHPPAAFPWDEVRDWTRQTLHMPMRPNAFSLMRMNEGLRARGIRVILTGEGGDDWFGGDFAHWADLVRQGRLGQLLREWREVAPGSPYRSVRALLATSLFPWLKPWKRHAFMAPHVYMDEVVPSWVRREWAHRVDLPRRSRAVYVTPGLRTLAERRRSRVFSQARIHINLDNVLSYLAAQGVELRHPFHDRRLAEFAVTVPGGVMYRHGRKKYLLRKAMEGTLPPGIQRRGNKATFAPVLWDALVEVLDEERIRKLGVVRHGWLDGEELCRLWRHETARHQAGQQFEYLSILWFAVAADEWMAQVL